LSWIDVVLAVFLLTGMFHGYKAGFLLELFSLTAVILGVLGGFKLMGWAMVLLSGKIHVDEKVLPYVAFAIVFLVIVIVVNLLGKLLKVSLDRSLLGGIDQIAGGLLGLARTAFMLSIAMWIVDSLKLAFFTRWSDHSWLYQIVAGFAPKITEWISDVFPVFRDVF
jgi:membrane protein required for colicin V production